MVKPINPFSNIGGVSMFSVNRSVKLAFIGATIGFWGFVQLWPQEVDKESKIDFIAKRQGLVRQKWQEAEEGHIAGTFGATDYLWPIKNVQTLSFLHANRLNTPMMENWMKESTSQSYLTSQIYDAMKQQDKINQQNQN